jgi:hypothetical protein
MEEKTDLSDKIDEIFMDKTNRKMVFGAIFGYALTKALPQIFNVEEVSVIGWVVIVYFAYMWMQGK